MVRSLLIRGMIVGVVAGLLAFGFAKLFGEPQVDSAIAFEDQMQQAMHMGAEEELVSREVQSTIGLFTGVVVYSAAFGGLFALVFAFASGRIGNFGPRATAAILAAAVFVAIVLVPALKYPPNPPSVGDSDTIRFRSGMFFLMMAVSVAAMVAAFGAARRLAGRFGGWNGALLAAGGFVVVIAAALWLLPAINEVPEHFPAVVLWRFRVASLGIELILWTVIGLLFGALTERSLAAQYRFTRPALS
jgi:Probable cobalt transporter subunit (CbtA)